MGNILKDINNPDLINPFDITKGKINGETEVISIARVPDDSNTVKSLLHIDAAAEHIKMINKLNPNEAPAYISNELPIQCNGDIKTGELYGGRDEFITNCVEFLKYRNDKYEILEEIKSLI